jgi:hypothetical protein
MTRNLPRWIVKQERLTLVCPACSARKPMRYDRTVSCCGAVHIAPPDMLKTKGEKPR